MVQQEHQLQRLPLDRLNATEVCSPVTDCDSRHSSAHAQMTDIPCETSTDHQWSGTLTPAVDWALRRTPQSSQPAWHPSGVSRSGDLPARPIADETRYSDP